MLVWAAPEMTGIVWSPSACLDREYAVDANSAASVGKPAGDSQEVGIAAGVGYGANEARNAWIAPAGRLPDIPADFSADSSFDLSDSSIESASTFSPYRPMRPHAARGRRLIGCISPARGALPRAGDQLTRCGCRLAANCPGHSCITAAGAGLSGPAGGYYREVGIVAARVAQVLCPWRWPISK